MQTNLAKNVGGLPFNFSRQPAEKKSAAAPASVQALPPPGHPHRHQSSPLQLDQLRRISCEPPRTTADVQLHIFANQTCIRYQSSVAFFRCCPPSIQLVIVPSRSC